MTDLVVATDADVAEKAMGDWPSIVPVGQRLAAGDDGAFAPGDRWTLASASNDFAAAGVSPGCVLVIDAIGAKSREDMLIVLSVSGNSATLRRPGMAAGQGFPPAPASGAAGVRFAVDTVKPQIETATFDMRRRYGIDALADLIDPGDLKRPVVLAVLANLYFSATDAPGDPKDPYAIKADRYRRDLDASLGGLSDIYGGPSEGSRSASAPMLDSVDAPLLPPYFS